MKKIISVILSVVLMINATLFSGLAQAIGTDESSAATEIIEDYYPYIEVPYSYDTGLSYGGYGNFNYSDAFMYSDEFWFDSAVNLSPDMVKMSAALSACAYTKYGENFKIEYYGVDNLKNLYENYLGFTVDYDNYAETSKITLDDCDTVSFSIAHKNIMHNGEEYIAYLVPIQGTNKDEQWMSDFNIGTGTDHLGFSIATTIVENELLKILKNDSADNNHTLILTTGHSRGAAVANILAYRLSEKNLRLSRGNIFCYTFACPLVTQTEDKVLYKNIYNFNNPGDGIPQVPLADWGYKRHGVTIELSVNKEIYNTFKQRYRYEYGYEYEGGTDTYELQTVLKGILGSEVSDCNTTAWKRFALNYAAYTLMDKSQQAEFPVHVVADFTKSQITGNVSLGDDAFYSALKIWETSDKIVEFLTNPVGDIEKVDKLLAGIEGKTDEEAERYLQENTDSEFIERIKQYVSEVKSESIKIILVSFKNSDIYKFLQDNFFVFSQISQTVETLANETDEHNIFTYCTWINVMFYGNNGWKGIYYSSTEVDGSTAFNKKINQKSMGEDPMDEVYVLSPGRTIGSGCFEYCNFTDNTEITIPEGVKYISESAFSSSNITKLVVPDTVDYLGANMLYDCENLGEVTLPFAGNNRYENENCVVGVGQSLSTGKSPESFLNICSAVYYKHYSDYPYRLHKVTITGGKTIPDSYFGNFRSISEVELADSITEIGNFAFNYCNLSEIYLPSNLKYVGANAFERCSLSCDLIFPEGLKEIGNEAFAYNAFTTENNLYIPGSVEKIGDGAFAYSGSYNSVILEDGIGRIGSNVFSNVRRINEMKIPYTGSYIDSDETDYKMFATYVGGGSVSENTKIGKITVTGGTRIQPYSLYNAEIDELILPETLKTIEDHAFSSRKLSKVYLPDSLETIGDYAFYGTSTYYSDGISEIHIPSNLKYVGNHAFERCSLSCDLIFPEGMEYIGESAFSSNALTENNNIYVPGTVKEIGYGAFAAVGENIGSIIIDNGVGKVGYGILNKIRSIDTLSLPYIGNTPDSLGEEFTYFSFNYSDFSPRIDKLYITGGKIIPSYALNCHSTSREPVREIFISEPVEVIEEWAFGANNPYIVHLPTSIKKIGSNAFSYYSYPVIEYRGTQEEWNAIEADSYLSENSVTFKPFVRNRSYYSYSQAYENEDISFNVTVSDNTNCEQIEYQWQYIPLSDYYSEADNWVDFGSDAKIENNFYDYSGMSNSSIVYTMNDKYDGAVVRCIISNQYGSVIQKFGYINLIQHPEITLQPEPQTVKTYQQVTLSADYTGKGNSIRWQYSDNGGSSWFDCGGYAPLEKDYIFTQESWYGDRYYRAKIYNAYEEIYTDPVLVSVKNDLIITSQPTSLSVSSGEHAYFTFDVEGDELEYTWYYKTPDSSVFVESPDYKWNYFAMQAGAENNGTKVYCIVKDRYGVSKMTDTVSLTVTGLEVKITEQPSNVSVSAGEKANFSLIASGNGLKYTWYYKLPSSKTYKKYADNMTNVFEMSTSKSKNGTKVYCVVTDSTGKTVKTDTVTLTVS